jgi:hypothetical protein
MMLSSWGFQNVHKKSHFRNPGYVRMYVCMIYIYIHTHTHIYITLRFMEKRNKLEQKTEIA